MLYSCTHMATVGVKGLINTYHKVEYSVCSDVFVHVRLMMFCGHLPLLGARSERL